MANQPYTYGIPDGTYTGRPTTASCYEKDGRLILDIRFAVKDPKTGTWYVKDNGYEWDPTKRHWLTSKDGGFNEATINGLRAWCSACCIIETKWLLGTIRETFRSEIPLIQGLTAGLWQDHVT